MRRCWAGRAEGGGALWAAGVGTGLRKREGRGVRAAAGLERGVGPGHGDWAGGKKCGLGQGNRVCGLSAEENWAKIERVGFSCFGFGLGLLLLFILLPNSNPISYFYF